MALAAGDAMLVGQKLGPFEIDKELGSGAMGTVYRARYTKTGQRVAIKIISAGLLGNETAMKRFEREISVLKQLNHPNIVKLLANGRAHKSPFYAMEYVEGESLDRVLERRGRYTWEEVVELGRQLCAALQHAHDQGIVHRDLKPSNVMILRDGTVKLTDFGIAKDLDVTALTEAHCTVGTASYMSPEQCRGEKFLTHKSDLYSMGVMFYELVTGRKPFVAETTMDMFLQHTQGTFERPSRLALEIPVWFDTLICQLLEKKPEHRPLDAATVAAALERVLDKVSAQQSAGVDAAKARYIDRMPGQPRADDTDKDAARTLLSGKGRRKRRKRPWYDKAWVKGAGISAVLLGLVALLYTAFKPASPDRLFADAQKLMTSANPDDRDKARDGPIKEYLKRYGDRSDDQARQMWAWADDADLATLERQLANRTRMGLTPDSDSERTAFRAVRYESGGELKSAAEQWQSLAGLRESKDPEQRPWGVLAERRLRDLGEATQREQQLVKQMDQAHTRGQVFKGQPPFEQQVVDALYAEMVKNEDVGLPDLPLARERWLRLKNMLEKNAEQRAWFLLAARHAKDLEAEKAAPRDKEQDERLERVKAALAKVQELIGRMKEPQARLVCLDLVAVYQHTSPELDALLQPAVLLLQGDANRP